MGVEETMGCLVKQLNISYEISKSKIEFDGPIVGALGPRDYY